MFRPLTMETTNRDDRSKDEVHASLVIFAITCGLIRFAPIIMRKISS